MKKIIILIGAVISVSALAESEVICQDAVFKNPDGRSYQGGYETATKKLNEEIRKSGASTVSAPTVSLGPNNSAVICVTLTR